MPYVLDANAQVIESKNLGNTYQNNNLTAVDLNNPSTSAITSADSIDPHLTDRNRTGQQTIRFGTPNENSGLFNVHVPITSQTAPINTEIISTPGLTHLSLTTTSAIPSAQTVEEVQQNITANVPRANNNPLTSTMYFHPAAVPSFDSHIFNTTNYLSQSQINSRQSVPKELPLFSGQPEEWPLFSSTFYWSTQACGFTDAENLIRLQRSLKGSALQSVQQMLIHPSNVSSVMEILQVLYGQPEKIINSIKTRIKMTSRVYENNLNSLTTFAVNVRSLVSTIVASNLSDEINNTSFLHDLLLKLPASYQMQWATQKLKLLNAKKSPNLAEFDRWMFNIGITVSSIAVNNLTGSNNINVESRSHNQMHNNKAFVHSHGEGRKYIICNKNCKSVDCCKQYLKLDRGEEWRLVREHMLCKFCLHKHKGECKKRIMCGVEGCQYFHHSSLHNFSEITREQEKEKSSDNENTCQNNNSEQIVNSHCEINSRILFKIVTIKLFGVQKFVDTFALIDEGSSVSLMDESLMIDLDIQGVPKPLCLRWTGGVERTEDCSKKLVVEISGLNMRRS